jgi:DNA-binding ferritin-like protein (Dps family)
MLILPKEYHIAMKNIIEYLFRLLVKTISLERTEEICKLIIKIFESDKDDMS